MIYKTFTQLASASFNAIPDDLIATDETRRLSSLISVYFEALHNPPPSVIGVGAISYAERMLVAAQK